LLTKTLLFLSLYFRYDGKQSISGIGFSCLKIYNHTARS
jgi:hypothetical protein